MKFGKLIIIILVTGFFISACASPAVNETIDSSNGVGEDNINIGDLIGNLGGEIDDGDENDGDDEGTSDTTDCDDPNAEYKGGQCVCKDGYSDVDGSCIEKLSFGRLEIDRTKLTLGGDDDLVDDDSCTDPKAEIVDGECVCKKHFRKNSDGNCVLSGKDFEIDKGTAAALAKDVIKKGLHNIEAPEPNEILVDRLEVTLKTDSYSYGGTNAGISFTVRTTKDESTWTSFDYNGSDTEWTTFDKPNYDDFKPGKVDTYTHKLEKAVPLDKITAFTIDNDGKGSDPNWWMQGIVIKAFFVDDLEEPVVLYANFAADRFVPKGEVNLRMNDVAIHTTVYTDKEGTENNVEVNIGLKGPNNSTWEDDLSYPQISTTSEGLQITLDRNELGKNKMKYDYQYGSMENVDKLNIDYAYLKLTDSENEDDDWLMGAFEVMIFRPARVLARNRGERACWLIEGRNSKKIVLKPGERTDNYFPKSYDCSGLVENAINYHMKQDAE